MTERQEDQAVADNLRAEYLRRANAVNAERFEEDWLGRMRHASIVREDGTVANIDRSSLPWWESGAKLSDAELCKIATRSFRGG